MSRLFKRKGMLVLVFWCCSMCQSGHCCDPEARPIALQQRILNAACCTAAMHSAWCRMTGRRRPRCGAMNRQTAGRGGSRAAGRSSAGSWSSSPGGVSASGQQRTATVTATMAAARMGGWMTRRQRRQGEQRRRRGSRRRLAVACEAAGSRPVRDRPRCRRMTSPMPCTPTF